MTFFFNDYREEPFPGEDRTLIPSPKVDAQGRKVDTYDQKPEMSAPRGVRRGRQAASTPASYDLIVVNFANGDMVGHTGNLAAAIKAVETVDACVGKILDATQRQGGVAIVTADHGNASRRSTPTTGGPHTAHTTYDVPLIVVDDRFKGKQAAAGGRLADIAADAAGDDGPAQAAGDDRAVAAGVGLWLSRASCICRRMGICG